MKTSQKTWPFLVALLLIGVLVRALLLGGYTPATYPDSSTYIAAAHDLRSGDFNEGQGRRTPGYPLLIALVGDTPQHIVMAQMVAGLAVSVLLFFIALRMTQRPWLAFAAGLSYHLNLQQLFLEGAVVTESLTTLLLAAMVVTLLWALQRLRDGKPAATAVLGTGVLAAAALMVRPQFIFLPLLLPLLVIYAPSAPRRPTARAWGYAAVVALPSIIAVLGWASVLQAKTGHFALSTQSGFGLVNHSVEFIELAPERYAVVRDILLTHRAERIAAAGHAGNTVWYALPDIRSATGWTLPEASKELQRMSTQMFAEHPMQYALSVTRPWLEFWTVPIIWEPQNLRPAWLAEPLEVVWWIEHKLLRLSNLVFVLLVVGVLLSRRVRQAARWDLNASAISALILASSLLQAMADRGAGSRYAVTTQALLLLVVVASAVRWRAGHAASSTNALEVPHSKHS